MPADDLPATFASPDGRLRARLELIDGRPAYALSAPGGADLLAPSRLRVEVAGAAPLDGPFAVAESAEAEREARSDRLYGPAAAPTLRYRERVLVLRETLPPHRTLRVEARLFDAGLATRLTLLPAATPYGGRPVTARDRTEFALAPDAVAYESLGHEDEFRPTPVRDLKSGCWLPMTVRAAGGGPYLCVAESDDTDDGAPQTLLSPLPRGREGTLVAEPRGAQRVAPNGGCTLPWRAVLFGATPAALAEAGDRVLPALIPRSKLGPDAAGWVRPGKAIREVTLSTPGGLACIDFAAEHGLRYILYDAGWYGHEYDDASDARRVSLDPDRVKNQPDHPGLDLRKVIDYGKTKGVGVFLYVNRRALERQVAEIAPLYQSWGVAGVKFGFVNVGPQEWTAWLREAVAACARHKLLIDIHDAYRPVGLSGAYPNLLTQEGIRGNEHFPTPRHNCTLPFTRFVSGAGDYTVCYRQARLKTTDAHQMALAVVAYSPLQLLYWYSRPAEFEGLPELAFFDAVPTVWDETRVLAGEIGEFAVVARRSGADWFVGAITNEDARTVRVPLDFLPAGARYRARLFQDRRGAGGKADLPLTPGVSRVEETARAVTRADALDAALAPGGGLAVWLTPERAT